MPAYLFARRAGILTILSRSIVVSLLLVSAISWVPGADRVPVYLWTWVILALSLVGLGGLIVLAIRRHKAIVQSPVATAAAIALFGVFVLILMTRAIVEWDAVNYYLYAAVGIANTGHYINVFPHSIAFSQSPPNTIPPIMPTLYAVAIVFAQILHVHADDAIRLLPIVFIGGIFASTYRIARHYVGAGHAAIAAILALLLPATVAVTSSAPLLLDLCFCFLATQLLAELLDGDHNRYAWAFFYLTASTAIIEKIDGLPYVILLCAIALFGRLKKRSAQTAFALTAIAMVAAGAFLHIFTRSATTETYIAIVIVALLFIFSARNKDEIDARLQPNPWGLIGLFPAALDVYRRYSLTGSPAGYYIPSIATKQSAAWHQALSAILQSNPYTPTLQPGLPANFGIGLVLWWGFGPPLMIAAIVGAYFVLRHGKGPVLPLQLLLAFQLAFLTVFGLDDFRHLLPIVPLLAILAVFGLLSMSSHHFTRTALAVGLFLATLPFAWVAQERFFSPPFDMLQNAQIDQWHQLSELGVITTASYCLAIASLALILLAPERITRFREAASTSLAGIRSVELWAAFIFGVACVILFVLSGVTLLLCGPLIVGAFVVLPSPFRRVLRFVMIAAAGLALWFEPVVVTAFSPGFATQRGVVENQEAQGYIPTLRWSFEDPTVTTIATFEGYGVTWMSLGRVRRMEMGDASDLSAGAPALKDNAVIAALEARNVEASILPSQSNAYLKPLVMLLDHLHSHLLSATYNPLMAYTTSLPSNGAWTYARFLPRTTLSTAERITTTYRTTKSSLSIVLPRSLSSKPYADVTVLGYGLAHRSSFPLVGRLREPISKGTVSLQYGAIAAAMLQKSDSDRNTLFVIRSVQLTFPNSDQTIAYNSEGYVLNGEGTSVKPKPFFINGGDSLVSSVELRGANGHSVTASWPKSLESRNKARSDAHSARLMLTPSGQCPPESPIDVTVTAPLDKSTHVFRLHTRLAEAVDIPFEEPVPSGTALSIEVRGEGVCRVDETLGLSVAHPRTKHQDSTFAVRTVEVH